ncbi:hypothetical protein POL68_36995 [Stigmatella sp. ncwal1]|uniref:Calx-beta domain-containing protein n=1 Tax=Stigmatella ashevillensis TaxID=2995309 RepID=A0ABT5DP11_9BACT|nr:hypothetical protein [Stigmatella ashevillena]MDC0714122.1 hypothetical protein [Stigmatella ashevillena]
MLLACFACLACETSPTEPEHSQGSFALAAIDDVTVDSGEQLLIKILVLRKDKDPRPVELSAEGLPTYATLEGETLTVAPGPKEWGDSHVTVVATNGRHTDRQEFLLRVIRPNKAPRGGNIVLEDEGGMLVALTSPVVRGTPTLWAQRVDEDFDAVRLRMEVVPESAAFTGAPTHESAWMSGDNWQMRITLSGLPTGQRFKLRAWPEDALGATGQAAELTGLVYLPRPVRQAVADPRTCDGEPVDVSSDPRHCGECGHTCLGAACTQGICATTWLAGPAMETPKALALDTDFVYWTGEGRTGGLYRMPKAGGEAVRLNVGRGDSMAVNGGRVYLIGTGLLIISLEGAESPFYDPTAGGTNIVSFGEQLYWTTNNTLKTRPKKFVGTPSVLVSVPGHAMALRVDDSGLYVTTQQGSVFHSPLEGGALTPVATGLTRVSGLATDEQFVYVAYGPPECAACPSFCPYYRPFSCFTTSTLARIPKTGGTPEVLAQVSGMANTLTVDGQFLYWSHDGRGGDLPLTEGSVMRMPKAGGTPLVLADGLNGVRSLALDAHSVYGYTPDKGVFRAPK